MYTTEVPLIPRAISCDCYTFSSFQRLLEETFPHLSWESCRKWKIGRTSNKFIKKSFYFPPQQTPLSGGLLNCGLRVAGHRLHCRLRVTDCGLRVAGHTQVAGCGPQIAGCRPHSDCRLRATDCGLLTAVLRAAGHRLRAAGHMLWIAKIAGC